MYTKFTHTIASLMGVLAGFYAVSGDFRDYVAALGTFYAAHVPHILQPLPALFVALWMWYRNGKTDTTATASPSARGAGVGTIGSAFLPIVVIVAMVGLTGCVSQLLNAIDFAQASTKAAGRILTPVNPEYGDYLTAISGDLATLHVVVSDFDSANASAKGDKAAAVRAASATLENDLTAILALARIKNPEKVEYVTVFVAIGAAVVDESLNHLPAKPVPVTESPATAQAAQLKRMTLPRLRDLPGAPTAKNAGDLKKIWNTRVAAVFPESKL